MSRRAAHTKHPFILRSLPHRTSLTFLATSCITFAPLQSGLARRGCSSCRGMVCASCSPRLGLVYSGPRLHHRSAQPQSRGLGLDSRRSLRRWKQGGVPAASTRRTSTECTRSTCTCGSYFTFLIYCYHLQRGERLLVDCNGTRDGRRIRHLDPASTERSWSLYGTWQTTGELRKKHKSDDCKGPSQLWCCR